MNNTLQIDVLNFRSGANDSAAKMVECNLYTGDRCVRMYLEPMDYKLLMNDGFFIRDGKTVDSAGVLNTTAEFIRKGGKDE
ncbi:MAG: hypothetical protein IT215_00060 [Chitinophagaceae bacterium]|nr:hypothetical protein [Chitinophagaceae bacterium]